MQHLLPNLEWIKVSINQRRELSEEFIDQGLSLERRSIKEVRAAIPTVWRLVMLSPHTAVPFWPIAPENFFLANGWQTTRFATTQAMAAVIETIVGAMAERGYSSRDIFGVR